MAATVVSGASFSADGATAAMLLSKFDGYTEVAVSPVAGYAPRTLTAFHEQYRACSRPRRSWCAGSQRTAPTSKAC